MRIRYSKLDITVPAVTLTLKTAKPSALSRIIHHIIGFLKFVSDFEQDFADQILSNMTKQISWNIESL